ncbi:MAG: glycosyltransferase family 2 protein [Halioglobus sp.]
MVIVNFNGGDLLARCIAHLENQSRPADRILVVDNHSTDNSLDALSMRPAVEVVRLEENLGFAAANNIAFRELADTDYIITLNPDAFPEPDFIESLQRAAERHPDCASFATRMLRCDGRIDGRGDTYHVSGLVWRTGHGQPNRAEELMEREVFAACAGAAMYRTPEVIAAGGFDESFFCYLEDVDLGYRLQLGGHHCLYIPEATVVHIGSAVTGQYDGFATYHGHRNLVWTFVKNTPGALLPVVLLPHLFMTLVMAVVCAGRGDLGAYARAKRDAVAGLRRVMRKRKEVQSGRKLGALALLRKFDFSILPPRSVRRHQPGQEPQKPA